MKRFIHTFRELNVDLILLPGHGSYLGPRWVMVLPPISRDKVELPILLINFSRGNVGGGATVIVYVMKYSWCCNCFLILVPYLSLKNAETTAHYAGHILHHSAGTGDAGVVHKLVVSISMCIWFFKILKVETHHPLLNDMPLGCWFAAIDQVVGRARFHAQDVWMNNSRSLHWISVLQCPHLSGWYH